MRLQSVFHAAAEERFPAASAPECCYLWVSCRRRADRDLAPGACIMWCSKSLPQEDRDDVGAPTQSQPPLLTGCVTTVLKGGAPWGFQLARAKDLPAVIVSEVSPSMGTYHCSPQ